MSSPSTLINELRRKIDAVDDQILALLGERAALARAIGEEKKRLQGAPPAHPQASRSPTFFDPEREQAITRRLREKARDILFPQVAVPYVFKEIISACRSLEASFRVAFLGPAGTYTQMAAERIFGHSVHFIESASIDGVFHALERDQAEYGVVPIQNSYEGGVLASMDALIHSELRIRQQTTMRVHHCLLSRAPDISRIRRLYSHPQALGQCRLWIAKNLPGIEVLTSPSTAAAARAASEDEAASAIASRRSGELLGLNLLREDIQDQPDNSTRFVVLARADAPVTGEDQTSVVLSLSPKKGALVKLLELFEREKVAIRRLESRAHPDRLWEYYYFIDFEGHRLDPPIQKLLKRLPSRCDRVKVLGSYPISEALPSSESPRDL